jgi:hypothetical protein
MFNPGDLVKVKIPGGEPLGVIIGWAASSKGKDLWWVMIDGKRSHYYLFDHQLEIVSKANV